MTASGLEIQISVSALELLRHAVQNMKKLNIIKQTLIFGTFGQLQSYAKQGWPPMSTVGPFETVYFLQSSQRTFELKGWL